MRAELVIGIAGASGSGKTTLAAALQRLLGVERVALLHHDHYYRDLSMLPPHEREEINFDHPDALESDLLAEHIRALRAGVAVEVPRYDFRTHTRLSVGERLAPRRIVVVEGILLLAVPTLRAMCDVRIFVDADPDICLIRRLRRDIRERGRTMDQVIEQYLASVRPMWRAYVEPSRQYADIMIPQQDNQAALQLLVSALHGHLQTSARTE
ncbi:MAG: uridine kinase [Zetaproteobacteria bacterium]|nr:MAG: uridine kinase [Zetaproteobacteria bacterium]